MHNVSHSRPMHILEYTYIPFRRNHRTGGISSSRIVPNCRKTPQTPLIPFYTQVMSNSPSSITHTYFLTPSPALTTTFCNSPNTSLNSSTSSSLISLLLFVVRSLLTMTTLVGLLVALASPSCARDLM